MARVLALFATALAIAGCAAGGASPGDNTLAGARPLGPFYGVPADMLRPDGTMINGLLPIDPNDQS
ncbi:MAG TPA: hypothetical protein VFN46_01585 [Acetobacteraceae bacterium]|nr:hypothetical protein [Acetobacteraceae bacterium]